MKKVAKIVAIAFIAAAFVSCSKNKQVEDYDPQLFLQAYALPLTRYAGESGFETGDVVGVYVVKKQTSGSNDLKNSGNYVDNSKFINEFSASQGNILKPETGKEVYLVEGDTYDIYSYFPYANTVNSITEVPFSVKTDQSAAADFLGSDFLWAKTSDVKYKLSPVKVEYKHLFSQLTLTLTAGNGFTNEDIAKFLKSVTVKDVVTDAKINIAQGVAVAGANVGTIITNKQSADANVFRVMLIPQNITDSKTFIDIEMGDKHYPIAMNLAMVPGKSYLMNVNVDKDFSKTVITLNGVVAWDNEALPDQDVTVTDPKGDNLKTYCDINATGDNSSAYVEGVTVGTFECGSSVGKTYIDYAHDLGVSAKIVNGDDIMVKFKNIDMPTDARYKVYVFADWNNDGDFQDTKEMIDMLETVASVPNRVQTLPFTVDIPVGSVSPTTVRIVWGVSNETDAYNGCGHSVDGGVYDVGIEF